jgi:hypothetical protein
MPPDPIPPTPDGVDLLLAGWATEAVAAFRAAIDDGRPEVVHRTGLAAALAELGDPALADALATLDRLRPARRADRHHVEVVALALRGRCPRATGLGHEHLADAPDDRLVGHVLARWCGDDLSPARPRAGPRSSPSRRGPRP